MTKDKALQAARDALKWTEIDSTVEPYQTIQIALRVLIAEIEGGWNYNMDEAPIGTPLLFKDEAKYVREGYIHNDDGKLYYAGADPTDACDGEIDWAVAWKPLTTASGQIIKEWMDEF